MDSWTYPPAWAGNRLGLTAETVRVMAAFVELGATQSEIARRLGIASSSVSIALKSLER